MRATIKRQIYLWQSRRVSGVDWCLPRIWLKAWFHRRVAMPLIHWYLSRSLLREAWHNDEIVKVYTREEYEAAKFGVFDKAMKRFRYG
jgi:hypothetical protein